MKTIQITDDEESAIVIWLNIELRDENHTMSQKYANTLNGLFVKLVGRNHDVWDKREGKYGQ